MSDPNPSNAVQMLPPGWVALESQTAGVYYYYNTYTGVTQWERPVVPVHPAAPPAPPAPPSAPPATTTEKPKKKQKKEKIPIPGTDWLLVRTPDGLEFYFHKETKTSVWQVPPEIEGAVKEMKEQEEASKKRKLEDENQQEAQESKRQKAEQQEEEPEAGTEMTEEDIMWQLQNMDPEEAAALGLTIDELKKEKEGTAPETQEEKPPQQQQQAPAEQDQMSQEERIEKFTQMLSEKNISPFSTWERELPKFINDPRYSLVEPHSKRKNLFNNFCRVLAEEQKANKPKAKDPEEEYLDLVKEIANAKMYWEDFRRKAKNDKRFKAIRESRVRESIFKDYMKQLRKNAEKGGGSGKSKEDAYKDLLKETKEIRPGMRWRDAKVILEKDKRYHDIESKTLREDMFRDYLETLE